MGWTDSEAIATAIGAFTGFMFTVLLRIMDFFLPKGRMSRYAERYSVPVEPEKEEEDEDG